MKIASVSAAAPTQAIQGATRPGSPGQAEPKPKQDQLQISQEARARLEAEEKARREPQPLQISQEAKNATLGQLLA